MRKKVTLRDVETKGIMSIINVSVLRDIMLGKDEWAVSMVLELVEAGRNIRIYHEKMDNIAKQKTDLLSKICFSEGSELVIDNMSLNLLKHLIALGRLYPLLNVFVVTSNVELINLIAFKVSQLKLDQYEIFQQKRKQA